MRWIVPVILCALLSPAARAQEAPAEPAQEEIVEQILELQRRIEELMAALPPGVRTELRRRLAEPPPPAPVPPVPAATEDVVAAPAIEPIVEPVAEPAGEPTPEPTGAPAPPVAAESTRVIAAASPGATDATAPATAPSAEGLPKLIRRRSQRAPCNTLRPLDENGDGKISSADRYWRYFYLWTDRNGDNQLQDREVESAYERKVRELAVSLETFVRTKGGLGEVRIDDRVVLDLRGDGFSERSRRDDGILVVDAGALGRGDGPRLLGPGGEALEGFQAFRSGLRLEVAGEVTALNCP